MRTTWMRHAIMLVLAATAAWNAAAQAPPTLKLERDDRVVFLGNTFAERLYHFGHLELLLGSPSAQLARLGRQVTADLSHEAVPA